VGMQVPILVHIEVTGTQVITGNVNDILADDVEVGYPLRLIVIFQNTGNVAAAPLIEATITYNGEDVASFRGVFMRVTGLSPTEYRRRYAPLRPSTGV